MKHSKDLSKKKQAKSIKLPQSCYLVGGYVRDKLLGIEGGDKDWLVVGSNPKEMKSLGFIQVGKDFPVFINPETKEEYALARVEVKKGTGYYGFSCKTEDVSLIDDLKRRDITINSMALSYHHTKEILIDPFKGKADLENKIIRHSSAAFIEDPLRIIRVARFLAKFHHLGFQVHSDTINLLKKMVKQGEINHLTIERIWLEVVKVSQTQNPEIFFLFLDKISALDLLFNEFSLELKKDWFKALSQIYQQTSLTTSSKVALCFYGYGQKKQLALRYKLPNHLKQLFNLIDDHRFTLNFLNQKTRLDKELKKISQSLCQLFKDAKVLQEKPMIDEFILIYMTRYNFDLTQPNMSQFLVCLNAYLLSDVKGFVYNQKKIKKNNKQNLTEKINEFRENEVFKVLKNAQTKD